MPAFLFDLDGTLFDTAPDIADALDLTLAELALPPAGRERAIGWIGGGAMILLERALAAAASELTAEAALPAFMRHYATTNARTAQPYAGVRETLGTMVGRNDALACVTNKPERFARELLEKSGLIEQLPVIIGGDTLARRKPDALPLATAMQQLGVTAASTWMVGDSMTDMDAARAAGVRSAWVPYGYHREATLAELSPTVPINDFGDLLVLD